MGQKKTPVFPLDKAIGALLDSIRQEQGKSLRALATLTGISHSRIGAFFRGESALTSGETDALCASLGVAPLEVIRAAHAALEQIDRVPDFYAMAAFDGGYDPEQEQN